MTIQQISEITGFGVIMCLGGYFLGLLVKKHLKLSIFNPLLVAIILNICFLLLFKIDYQQYRDSSAQISNLLTPATVSLAIPLYRQMQMLKKNYKAILLGCISGCFISAVWILLICKFFGLQHGEYATMLPKSITTAIGMGVSQELGGNVNVTMAAIIITGIFGSICAEWVCKIAKLKSPVAKGVAIGTSAHAIGTTQAAKMGETEGAISSLSLIIAGIFTVILAPIMAQLW